MHVACEPTTFCWPSTHLGNWSQVSGILPHLFAQSKGRRQRNNSHLQLQYGRHNIMTCIMVRVPLDTRKNLIFKEFLPPIHCVFAIPPINWFFSFTIHQSYMCTGLPDSGIPGPVPVPDGVWSGSILPYQIIIGSGKV